MNKDSGITVDCDNLPWLSLAEGVGVRVLRLDRESGVFTLMVRAEAGAVLPRHRHLDEAEIYVILGAGTHPQTGFFKAGDYVHENKGALHEAVTFDEETILFMVNKGPSAFLNKDDTVAHIMDIPMLERLSASA